VVQVVPTGTSRTLRDAGPFTFLLAPNDSVEGAAIGRFVADSLKAQTVTLIYITDEYGYGLRDGVMTALEELGVEVLDDVPVPPSYQVADIQLADLESLMAASLARGEPDVVVLAARDFTTRAVVPFFTEAVPGIRFVAGDGVLLRGVNREAVQDHLERIYQVVFWNPGPDDGPSQDFVRAYRRLQGVHPGHDDALCFAALLLLAEAVREVGPDPERMRRYLLSLGVDRPAFPGITGPISFGEARALPIYIVRSDELPGR
jgi:ABC-type branched-subunit amino acid transport system substrate-binding protein